MNEQITFELNNRIVMPAFGLGVYRSEPAQTADAVKTALSDGYRLIDTAAAYGNESEVGDGIRAAKVPRDEIFVTTKLKPSDYGYDAALTAFDDSQSKLGLDVVDLYLLHWPIPRDFDNTIASWRAAEKLLADGRVRAIGVCNFNPAHLDALVEQSNIVPAVNQVELHPFLVQENVRAANERHGVITQAWSPIGGVNRYFVDNPDPNDDPLTHATIKKIAAAHDKTAAQVMLRWHLQRGVSVIPKSVRVHRIAENIDVFDFELRADEIAAIDRLDRGQRGGPDPATFG